MPICERCHGDGTLGCPTCNGSGEGVNGGTCRTCKGSSEVPCGCVAKERDDARDAAGEAVFDARRDGE